MSMFRFRKKNIDIGVSKRIYRRSLNRFLSPGPKREAKKQRHGARIEKSVSRKLLFFRFLFWFALSVFLFLSMYTVFFSTYTRIRTISLDGVNVISEERILRFFSDYMNEKSLAVFPRDNYFIFRIKDSSAGLLKEFRRIRSVEMRKIFPDTIRVKIVERDSPLLWCSGGPCFRLDEEGVAYDGFDEVADISDAPTRIIDESAQGVEMGSAVLSRANADFFGSIEKAFSTSSIVIQKEYRIKNRAASELVVMTQEGWKMYLNTEIPIETTISMVRTFLETIDIMKRNDLDYVDFRIENKVFYRVKNRISPKDETDLSASQEKQKNDSKKEKKKKRD